MLLNLKQEEYNMKNKPILPQEVTTDGDCPARYQEDQSAINSRQNGSTITADTANGVYSFQALVVLVEDDNGR